MISIDELSIYAKKKGFVYPSTEIYGGMQGFFDYGPFGVELKNNIKNSWWKAFVQDRDDVHGLDGSLISSGKIWEASGHLANFADLLAECSKCGKNQRADHLVEDRLKIHADGLDAAALNKLIMENKITCQFCKGEFKEINSFNLMFPIQIGAEKTKESTAYLRGETAQMIFVNFKAVADSSRVKVPFGIAQIGKAFRNEISPRNFLFRTREFEQMELEFFTRKDERCAFLDESHLDQEFLFYSEEAQDNGKEHELVSIKAMLEKKLLNEWHAYWLSVSFRWFLRLGIRQANLRVRQHLKKELSHYSSATFDIEYNFPFGWKEIHGNANRGQFDLTQHAKYSGKSMELFDEDTKEKLIPYVIEPSFGVDRAFLAVLYDAYSLRKDEGGNEVVVLKFAPKVAPTKVAFFPLVNKLEPRAREIYALFKEDFISTFDRSGSIGRRYARADELGIPYCVTIDFETLEDGAVTVRDRDTMKQERVKIESLKSFLQKNL
jgi:glycyl-tRNA synthetase